MAGVQDILEWCLDEYPSSSVGPTHNSCHLWLCLYLYVILRLPAAALSAHFEKLTTQVKTQPGQPQEVRAHPHADTSWQQCSMLFTAAAGVERILCSGASV